MIYDYSFGDAINEIIGDFKEEKIKSILSLISRQKFEASYYEKLEERNKVRDSILKNIIKLKQIFEKEKKDLPVEIKYREASIYFEKNSEEDTLNNRKSFFEKSEKLYNEIINENPDVWILDRSLYHIILLYLKNNFTSDEQFSKIPDYYSNLKERSLQRVRNGNTDSYVDGDRFKEISNLYHEKINNYKYQIVFYNSPDFKDKKLIRNLEDSYKLKDNFDIFIDITEEEQNDVPENYKIFIKGKDCTSKFNDRYITLLFIILKGNCNTDYVNNNTIDINTNVNLHQMISRLRKLLYTYFANNTISFDRFLGYYKFIAPLKISITSEIIQ